MTIRSTVRTAIIPDHVTIVDREGHHGLDHKAMCVFAAIGFFLEADTYFAHKQALLPATDYFFDAHGRVTRAAPYWSWHHTPREMSLAEATDAFAETFENITREQTSGRSVILPLSGGLDSRTQAVALRGTRNLQSYSYKFASSFDETWFGQRIADRQGFEFRSYEIPNGYLWSSIDEIAKLNGCYADFTHPRQMAVIDALAQLGDLFFLGHWGDVLFDDMGVPADLAFDKQVEAIASKLVKRGGIELAQALWVAWGCAGTFESYLRERIAALLHPIKIDDANARIRAFKSMYWAPRWTTTNLVTFSSRRAIALPYYHPEMCKLICTLPERHLSGRQIQIEYIKRYAPQLARVPWQTYAPLDLYTYKRYMSLRRLPYRAARKALRAIDRRASGKELVTRNWEIQFVGNENDARLREHLFDERAGDVVPPEVVKTFYAKFSNENRLTYAHPISMLLTLSMFARTRRDSSLAFV